MTFLLIFTLLLGNILTGLAIVVGWFTLLLVGGFTHLKYRENKKVACHNISSVHQSHLLISALVLWHFFALLFINRLTILLWCLGALLSVRSLTALLGNLLAMLVINCLAAFLWDLK